MTTSLQVLGLCRFSYPVKDGSGFKQKSDIYDIRRLSLRLKLFQRLWMPSMRGQTDKRFSVVVLIGTGLPKEIFNALQDTVYDCPQIILHQEEDGQPHIEVCSKVLRFYRRSEVGVSGEFILDDDDAVSLEFVAQVYRNFALLADLIQANNRVELNFCRGYVARINDTSCEFKEVLAQHWPSGQVIFQSMPSAFTVANFHHYRFWKKNLCVSVSRRPMFIRGLHESNDTGDGLSLERWNKFKSETTLPSPSDFASLMKSEFGVELTSTDEGSLRLP